MVLVPIRVRPIQGYHYPHRIEAIEIQSHERLESIAQRYSTNGSATKLYQGPNELPLNSSIGSHNLQDYMILECCRSPDMSAALSAVLKDLDQVRQIPPESRNRENLIKIIQTPPEIRNDPNHEIWQVASWGPDRLKSRTINCAIIKAVLQRQDRFQTHDLPQCNDCQSLYDALVSHNVWNGGGNIQRFQRQAHLFKPEKVNGRGKTVNWILVDEKLQILNRIKNEFRYGNNQTGDGESPAEDGLEEFVRRDNARHPTTRQRKSRSSTNNEDSASYLQYLADPSVQSPSRPQRLQNQSTSHTQSKDKPPQYASGPFAILATLYLAAHAPNGQRLLTLTEEQLKRLAQPQCRSNLYDKGRIRGRSAFACMDGLIKKGLVRKEIVRNSESDGEDTEKWGLLEQGEILGSYYLQFQNALNTVIPPFKKDRIIHDGASNNLLLCVDTREDAHFRQRIKWRCEDERVQIVEKELPAGDYIFLDQGDRNEYVVPIVIERKSWSDLADSLQGKGRSNNRLDCVKIGSNSNYYCGGNCQLCKMKRCGCSQIMFIIEGERCSGNDSTQRECNETKRCAACKQLIERHGVPQQVLERTLTKLQIEHGCYIQYTKSYNETITALFMIRDLLYDSDSFVYKMFARNNIWSSKLSYDSYRANTHSRNTEGSFTPVKINQVYQRDVEALARIFKSDSWKSTIMNELTEPERNQDDHGNNTNGTKKRSAPTQSDQRFPRKRRKITDEVICLDDSDSEEVTELDDSHDTINLLDDSQESVNLLDDFQDDDSVVLFDRDDRTTKETNVSAPLRNAVKDRIYHINGAEDSIYPLLILYGMDEYDRNFEKKVNDIWNKVYAEMPHDGLNQVNQRNLYDKATSYFEEAVKESFFPFVQRQTFMASSLWIQIKIGVQIRSVQERTIAEEIRRLLTDKPNRANSVSSSGQNPHPAQKSSSTPAKTRVPCNTGESISTYSSPAAVSLSRDSAVYKTVPRQNPHSVQKLSYTPVKTRVPCNTGESISTYSSSATVSLSRDSAVHKTVAPSIERRQPKSLNKDIETARLARLRRFDNPSTAQPSQKKRQDSWICRKCTFENLTTDINCCSVCCEPRTWTCSTCTCENSLDVVLCVACESPMFDFVSTVAVGSQVNHAISDHDSSYNYEKDLKRPAKVPSYDIVSSSTPKRSIRCGACGLEGHNRASATGENCPAYHSAIEVQRREAQMRKREEQILDQQEKLERLERDRLNAEIQIAEWKRQTQLVEESNAKAQALRAEELKRTKKKVDNMKKRQNKNR